MTTKVPCVAHTNTHTLAHSTLTMAMYVHATYRNSPQKQEANDRHAKPEHIQGERATEKGKL